MNNLKLSMELGRLVSGNNQPPVDLSDVSLAEMFEFSGLQRWAWCEALGISDSWWAQLRSGAVSVPEHIRERAIKIALAVAEARIDAVSFFCLNQKKSKKILFLA